MKKEFLKGLPYVFATCVLFPLLLMIINLIFYRGNGVKNSDVTKYINESKIDTVYTPENRESTWENYNIELEKYGHPVTIDRYSFYSPKYKKYLQLILFECFEKDCIAPDERSRVLMRSVTVTARINQQQFNNPAYGTKENPVPVFAIDLLDGDPDIMGFGSKKLFHVSDTINRVFVGQYLNRFMPKAEFKKMFRQ